MTANLLLCAMVVLAGCSPDSFENGEPRFFKVDRFASGPLTMQELQINIPEELAAQFADGGDCVLAKIEEFAAEAGDPETLDPSTIEVLSEVEEWPNLDGFSKRLILAQTIISNAGRVCSFGAES